MKITIEYWVANIESLRSTVLESMFEEEIPTLYGKGIDKVEFRMDKVSDHTSKSTAAHLAKKETERGLKCIPLDEMRVKSPYVSAMDFWAFGLLKRVLQKRHPIIQNGLWKMV
ncbi:uncharacterized protein TNCV_2529321 [Trichonephila clavipes]|nr:uncharacterized protein TNCV_2529321 [Trichonephila clavipes]